MVFCLARNAPCPPFLLMLEALELARIPGGYVLKRAGLVMVRVDGTRRLYGIDPNGIGALRNWLDGFWEETLTAFKQAAEQEQRKSEG